MTVEKPVLSDVEILADNSRREALKRGLQLALLSIPVVMVMNSKKALAEDESDLTKIKFHFQDHPNGSFKCSQCIYFVPPVGNGLTGVCRVIDGDVTPNSWCAAYRPA